MKNLTARRRRLNGCKAVVYWVHNERCRSPKKDGYVGVTINLKDRSKDHVSVFGKKVIIDVLTTGTRKQCLDYEKKLRSKQNIGWNKSIGGNSTFHINPASIKKISKILKGRIFSNVHRKRLSVAASNRVWDEESRKILSRMASQRALSEKTKNKIRRAMIIRNKNPEYLRRWKKSYRKAIEIRKRDPLAMMRAGRKTKERWKKLREQHPRLYMKVCANISQAITRWRRKSEVTNRAAK